MTRVLVTGGAGFIGSHLVRALLEYRDLEELIVIDNLWTGKSENLPLDDRLHFFKFDVSKMEFPLVGHFDEIYHLASPASPAKYLADPRGTMEANFVGALRCLDVLKTGGLFCYTSTSEVYGDPLVSPQREDYKGSVNCIGPRACYDESKRATEALLINERNLRDRFRLKIARIFNCYGPRTQPDDGRAVSNFISAALSGKHIEVYGSGQQTRCFGYVDDIVEGLCRLFWDTPDEFTGPLNIGSDRETTVLEIANWVYSQFKNQCPGIIHVDAAVDDPQQRKPCLLLAKSMLSGWRCNTPYEEGIKKTINWFSGNSNFTSGVS